MEKFSLDFQIILEGFDSKICIFFKDNNILPLSFPPPFSLV